MNRYFHNMSRVEYRPDAGPEETLVWKHYNAKEIVNGRPMEEWFRFAVSYFNAFRYMGGDDYYGERTHQHNRDWEDKSEHRPCYKRSDGTTSTNPPGSTYGTGAHGPQIKAQQASEGATLRSHGEHGHGQWGKSSYGGSLQFYKQRMQAAFEFYNKLGVRWYTACDRDFSPEFDNWDDTCRHLDEMVIMACELQKRTGVRPLYFSADLFSHPRYMNGSACNPDANIYAYACAQVKKALDMAKRLNAENFVFFHPRDGYQHPHRRHWFRDMSHLAFMYRMACQYKEKIGYRGHFLIQPKPHDPRRHQYESDAMSTMHMLRHFGLEKHFKLYIKPAYSCMLGRAYEHDAYVANAFGLLGMLDASDSKREIKGTTDVHATDSRGATYIMKCVIDQNGIQPGGFVLGGRLSRESFEPKDLFHGHILTMDTYARALKSAAKLIKDGIFNRYLFQRYISYKSPIGQRIENKSCTFEECEVYVKKHGEPKAESPHYEHWDNMFNYYVWGTWSCSGTAMKHGQRTYSMDKYDSSKNGRYGYDKERHYSAGYGYGDQTSSRRYSSALYGGYESDRHAPGSYGFGGYDSDKYGRRGSAFGGYGADKDGDMGYGYGTDQYGTMGHGYGSDRYGSKGYGLDRYSPAGYGYGSDKYGSKGNGQGGYGYDSYGSMGNGYGSDRYGYGSDMYGSQGYGQGGNGYNTTGYGYGSDRYGSKGYGQGGYGYDRYGSDMHGTKGYGQGGYGYDRHSSMGHGHGSDRYGSDRYGSKGYGQGGYSPKGYGYGSDKYGSDRYGSDRYGSDMHGTKGYGQGGYGSDRYGSDMYGTKGYGQGGYGSDRYGSDMYGTKGYGQGGYGSDRYGSDMYGTKGYGNGGYGYDRHSSMGYGYGSDRYGTKGYEQGGYGVDMHSSMGHEYGSDRYGSDRYGYGSDRYESDRHGTKGYGQGGYGYDRQSSMGYGYGNRPDRYSSGGYGFAGDDSDRYGYGPGSYGFGSFEMGGYSPDGHGSWRQTTPGMSYECGQYSSKTSRPSSRYEKYRPGSGYDNYGSRYGHDSRMGYRSDNFVSQYGQDRYGQSSYSQDYRPYDRYGFDNNRSGYNSDKFGRYDSEDNKFGYDSARNRPWQNDRCESGMYRQGYGQYDGYGQDYNMFGFEQDSHGYGMQGKYGQDNNRFGHESDRYGQYGHGMYDMHDSDRYGQYGQGQNDMNESEFYKQRYDSDRFDQFGQGQYGRYGSDRFGQFNSRGSDFNRPAMYENDRNGQNNSYQSDSYRPVSRSVSRSDRRVQFESGQGCEPFDRYSSDNHRTEAFNPYGYNFDNFKSGNMGENFPSGRSTAFESYRPNMIENYRSRPSTPYDSYRPKSGMDNSSGRPRSSMERLGGQVGSNFQTDVQGSPQMGPRMMGAANF